MHDATIAIITYKRPQWLGRLLKALSKQILDKKYFVDILVVDNASDEETRRIVALQDELSPFKIRYEIEETRGIVAARNKCVELFLHSKSKNLIFIDDDEWPKHDNWIQIMLDKKKQYSADIVTSHVISVGECGVPDWASQLMYGENRNKEGEPVRVFYTNNLLLSRAVLEEMLPAFDSRFLMTGSSDYHLAIRCYKRGFRAVYIDAPVEEEFPATRATVKWFVRRGFRSGIGFTRSHLFEDSFVLAFLKIIAMSAFRFFRGVIYIAIGFLTFSKLKIVDGIFRICSGVGTLAGCFGIKYDEYSRVHGK